MDSVVHPERIWRWWPGTAGRYADRMKIPPPLDRSQEVVARGWTTRDDTGSQAVVQTPGERVEAGVRLDGSREVKAGSRLDITGKLHGECLHVGSVSVSTSQKQPDLREWHARKLGLDAKIPAGVWKRVVAGWPNSPLNDHVVSGWGIYCAPPRDDPYGIRLLVGEIVVVRWMTEELRRWLMEVPPPRSMYATPLLANDWDDLLPW